MGLHKGLVASYTYEIYIWDCMDVILYQTRDTKREYSSKQDVV